MKLIALLRGINVSGQKKIPMADLKAALAKGGIENAQTYIQSGNIAFDSEESDLQKVALQIEKIILDGFGFEVPTLVLVQEDFKQIPNLNPFLTPDQETKALYVGYMYEEPEEANVADLEKHDTGADEFQISWPCIFMKYAEGIGKSKMDNNFFERKLKIRMTTRNWNTILKLSDM